MTLRTPGPVALAWRRNARLTAALRECETALTHMLADTDHISDEHIAKRHEREPDNGYDGVLLARKARTAAKQALGDET